MSETIKIGKSATADTRTCDFANVTQEAAIKRMKGWIPQGTDAWHALAALDRVTAERDDARTEAVELRAIEENLRMEINNHYARSGRSAGEWSEIESAVENLKEARAEIARLTATEDTPLGWCNVYPGRSHFHTTKDDALRCAGKRAIRVAVPVYERPPRATAVTEEARVVGACVRYADGSDTAFFAVDQSDQKRVEALALASAREAWVGGTAHQLVLGAQIGEGK